MGESGRMMGTWGMGSGMFVMGLVLVLAVLGIVVIVLLLRRVIEGDPRSRIRQGALDRLDLAASAPAAGRAQEPPGGEIEGILVIPDISGYTQFMRMSAFALAHAQYAISALLNSMIDAAEGVLATAKVEGDAILLYGVLGPGDGGGLTGSQVGETVRAIVGAFYRTRAELHRANACLCEACSKVDELEIKTVVHSGRILIYDLRGQQELSGLPVIVAHRLLKSDVGLERYVLITDAAGRAAELPFEAVQARHSQHYEGVGEVGGIVYTFDPAALLAGEQPAAPGFSDKVADAARKVTEGLRALRRVETG